MTTIIKRKTKERKRGPNLARISTKKKGGKIAHFVNTVRKTKGGGQERKKIPGHPGPRCGRHRGIGKEKGKEKI